jgi:hypothetical protein
MYNSIITHLYVIAIHLGIVRVHLINAVGRRGEHRHDVDVAAPKRAACHLITRIWQRRDMFAHKWAISLASWPWYAMHLIGPRLPASSSAATGALAPASRAATTAPRRIIGRMIQRLNGILQAVASTNACVFGTGSTVGQNSQLS